MACTASVAISRSSTDAGESHVIWRSSSRPDVEQGRQVTGELVVQQPEGGIVAADGEDVGAQLDQEARRRAAGP